MTGAFLTTRREGERTATRAASGLHRVLGVWAGLLLLVLYGTGAYLNHLCVSREFSYATPAQLQRPALSPLAVSGHSCATWQPFSS